MYHPLTNGTHFIEHSSALTSFRKNFPYMTDEKCFIVILHLTLEKLYCFWKLLKKIDMECLLCAR